MLSGIRYEKKKDKKKSKHKEQRHRQDDAMPSSSPTLPPAREAWMTTVSLLSHDITTLPHTLLITTHDHTALLAITSISSHV